MISMVPFDQRDRGGGASSSPLDLRCPTFDAFSSTSNRNVKGNVIHSFGAVEVLMVSHPACICPPFRYEFEHRDQKVGHGLALFLGKVILLSEDVR